MAHPRLRFLSVLIVSAAAAWCAWRFLPTSPVDRELVKVMASTTANPPFIISGAGSQDAPWSVRVLAPYRKADLAHEPTVVSLGDDPDGIFQTSPPSPVDLAVVLKNMQRLGAQTPAISSLLAWESPEAIAISALEHALSVFPSVVTATPLSRGATGTPIPPPFRRASIGPGQVKGDVTQVPAVNRLPLPGVILGEDNAYSGFTLLEHDPGGSPMLARWDDRLVLSFSLVAVLVERGLPFDGVEVDLGNFIKLGSDGPYVPIDKTGRISTAPGKTTDSRLWQAVALGDSVEGTPLAESGLVLLRDDQSNAEAPTRAYSSRIAPMLTDIASGAGMSEEKILTRPETWREMTILGIVAILLAFPSSRPRFTRGVLYAVVATLALAIHLIGFLVTSMWPPTLGVLGAVVGAFCVSHLFFRDGAAATSTSAAVATPTAATDHGPEVTALASEPTAPEPDAEPPAKVTKPDTRKGAAKKAAARKTAPKKSAPPAKTDAAPATGAKPAAKKAVAKKAAVKKIAARKAARGKKAPPGDPPPTHPS